MRDGELFFSLHVPGSVEHLSFLVNSLKYGFSLALLLIQL